MDSENWSSDDLITITKQEAADAHVDDMLLRQRNMRGEAGIGRSRTRFWLYQNWFVFTAVCVTGGLLAWGILEPMMHDLAYFQGEITEVTQYEKPDVVRFPEDDRDALILGELRIRDNRILLPAGPAEISDETVKDILVSVDLEKGQTIGIYADEAYSLLDETDLSRVHGSQPEMVALYIDKAPPDAKRAAGARDIPAYRQHANLTRYAFFAIVAGVIGLFLGAADGCVCRQPKRALLCGTVGLLVGLLGGFVSGTTANVVFAPLARLARKTEGAGGNAIMVASRALAWSLAGMTVGLGQGVALRSRKLTIYGFVGGVIGGLLGGMLFDPISWMDTNPTSAHISRLVGIIVAGAGVGLMIGVVELLARDAWLRMTQGPLAGKEFLVFRDVMYVGASPRSDIYLFNDDLVADTHAILRTTGDFCGIEAAGDEHDVFVNGQGVRRARLRPGDQITIGQTVFTFHERRR